MIALTVACAIACAMLVVAERLHAAPARAAAKLTASAAFVAAGGVAFARASGAQIPPTFAQAVMVGLILGAVGDACLLRSEKRWFLAGLVAFLLGHLAYVVGMATLAPIASWPEAAGWIAALPIAIGLVVLRMLWPRLGALRGPVIAYVATIAAMVVGALACARAGALPDAQRARLVAGACLFFVSDLAVARDRFVAHTFTNKLWGLPTYYAGQLLFAWTLAA